MSRNSVTFVSGFEPTFWETSSVYGVRKVLTVFTAAYIQNRYTQTILILFENSFFIMHCYNRYVSLERVVVICWWEEGGGGKAGVKLSKKYSPFFPFLSFFKRFFLFPSPCTDEISLNPGQNFEIKVMLFPHIKHLICV